MKMNDNMKEKIPKGWKMVWLGQVAKIKTGNSNVEDAVEDGEYPLFDRSLEIKRSNKYLFDTEAVIVPGEGTNFKPKYYKGKFDIHQRAYAIFDFKDIDGKYLYYLMHIIKRDLIRVSVGTTVISLRLPHFQNLKIIFPENPKEQQKIAEILETVDKAIEQTDKIIEKYKHIKQGLMQDLLTRGIDERGQIRSEKTHKFKDSPLGKIPEEWEVVKLGDIFNLFAGGDIDKLNFSYDKSNIFKYPIYSNTLENKGLYAYADSYKFPENSITITARGVLGVAIPRFEKFNAIIRLLVLVPKKKVNITFVSEYINIFVNFYIEETGVPQLTAPKASNHFIPLPPPTEQHRIASVLSQIDEVIGREQKYKEKLEKIKKGLMEDLLSGKIRVNCLINEEESLKGDENVSKA